MSKKYNVCVVGASGAVGQEMIKILEERDFPVDKFFPLASERSAGRTVAFKGEEIEIGLAEPSVFSGIEIGLFSPGAAVSKILAPEAAKRGCVVIDNTSQFRMDPEVPLVVPEVNAHALKKHKGIIANPNCSTVQMVLVLAPIHKAAKIKRVVVSTYQSTSGAGKEAMEELIAQTSALLGIRAKVSEGQAKIEKRVFPKQIAFNLIPHIDVFLENGYTKEEIKMVKETQKILEDDAIKVTATTVRVPVLIGHSESVNIETEKKLTVSQVREILNKTPGIRVVDDPSQNQYPTPIDAAGIDDTLVGRIREDISIPNGIDLWIVADNLRKGAALNAVQIAEVLVREDLLN